MLPGIARFWRWGVVLLFAALTAGALAGVTRLELDPSNERLFLRTDSASRVYEHFLATFGSDEAILVALYSPHHTMVTPEGLAALRQLTQALAAVPHVASVQSLTNTPDMTQLRVTPFGLAVPRLVPDAPLSPDEQLAAIQHNEHVFGTLLSTDLHTAGVVVIPATTTTEGQTREAWIAAVRTVAAAHAQHDLQTYVAGTPIERIEVTRYLERDQRLIVPLVLLVLVMCTFGFYRVKRFAALVLACVLLPLVWTTGVMGFADYRFNIVTSLLPAVILVVSVSLVFHILDQFINERTAGARGAITVVRAVRRVGFPCLFDAITTAIGFFSITTSPIPALQEFGLFAGLGVVFAAVVTFTLGPVALLWMDDLTPARFQHLYAGRLERSLTGLAGWVAAYRHTVLSSMLVLVLIALPGISRIQKGTDMIRALKKTAPLRISSEFIDRHLTGVNSLELLVQLPSHNAGGIAPATIRQILAFAQWVRSQPDVTAVFSPWEPLRGVPPELLEQDEQLMVLATLLPLAIPLDAWLDTQSQTLRLSARVRSTDSERFLKLAEHVAQEAQQRSLQVQITGRTYLLAQMARTLVHSQVTSLLTAAVGIFGIVFVVLRSWTLGFIATIPNVLPPLMIFGLMGWCGIELSSATTMIASVALGLLVDNTMHLLYHYHRATQEGRAPLGALAQTVRHVGRAMIFTTLILTLGFWVGMLGSFKPTQFFALLTGLTLVVALGVALLLVPAVLLTLARRSA